MARRAKIVDLRVWVAMLRPVQDESVVGLVVGRDRVRVFRKAKQMAQDLSMPNMAKLTVALARKGHLFALADAIEMPRDQTLTVAQQVMRGKVVPLVWIAFLQVARYAEQVMLDPPDRGWTSQVEVEEA